MRHASLMMGAGVAIGSVAVMLAYAAKRVSAASERVTLPAPPSFDTVETYDRPVEMEPGFSGEADTELDADWFDVVFLAGDAEREASDRKPTEEDWTDPDWPPARRSSGRNSRRIRSIWRIR